MAVKSNDIITELISIKTSPEGGCIFFLRGDGGGITLQISKVQRDEILHALTKQQTMDLLQQEYDI